MTRAKNSGGKNSGLKTNEIFFRRNNFLGMNFYMVRLTLMPLAVSWRIALGCLCLFAGGSLMADPPKSAMTLADAVVVYEDAFATDKTKAWGMAGVADLTNALSP